MRRERTRADATNCDATPLVSARSLGTTGDTVPPNDDDSGSEGFIVPRLTGRAGRPVRPLARQRQGFRRLSRSEDHVRPRPLQRSIADAVALGSRPPSGRWAVRWQPLCYPPFIVGSVEHSASRATAQSAARLPRRHRAIGGAAKAGRRDCTWGQRSCSVGQPNVRRPRLRGGAVDFRSPVVERKRRPLRNRLCALGADGIVSDAQDIAKRFRDALYPEPVSEPAAIAPFEVAVEGIAGQRSLRLGACIGSAAGFERPGLALATPLGA